LAYNTEGDYLEKEVNFAKQINKHGN